MPRPKIIILLVAILSCALCPILTAAEVVTIAGNGTHAWSGDSGPAAKAGIGGPFGVVIGPDGALYICETENHAVRRVDLKTGVITTVAGSGKEGYSGDGGPATKATCREPYEIRFDKPGNMYFVEMKNQIVRKVAHDTGVISTIAGTGKSGFAGDGGPATAALLNAPHSITLDAEGSIYIADIGNHRLRIVEAKSAQISTLSGTGKKEPTPDGAPSPTRPSTGREHSTLTGSTRCTLPYEKATRSSGSI